MNENANNTTAAETETKPAGVVETIGNFECFKVKETISFKAIDPANRKEGLEYAEIEIKGEKKLKRKQEEVEVAYPLLSNLGIAGTFDPMTGAYADKTQQFLFSLLQTAVFAEVRAFLDEGKAFSFDDISLETLVNAEPSKRGGRKAEIEAAVYDAALLAFEKWLAKEGKSKQGIALHMQMLKPRLRGADKMRPELVAKCGENWGLWFNSLGKDDQETHSEAFAFVDAKITAVLNADPLGAM